MENSQSKKILLAISGSIAAYKAADIVSLLVKRGHQVQCLLTQSALEFVSPLVLETLSGRPALHALFGEGVSGTEHIRLARWPDLIVFAPASANLLTRLSLGMADDLVSTVALATQAPMLVAPAMNTVMWENPVTQEHVTRLRTRGFRFVDPASGVLACGEEGQGKLATPETIVSEILAALEPFGQDLLGERILITAGPTISRIDAVRYMTNPSTGKMGAALAEEALARGAEIFYILGVDKGVVRPQVSAKWRNRFHLTEVETAEEMGKAALQVLPQVDGVIATAAVLDYRVSGGAVSKTKRSTESTTITLEPSIDVLASLRENACEDQWFLGFAAETDQLEENARTKLAKKNLDYVFVNQVARAGESLKTGFGTETNSGVLHRKSSDPVEIGLSTKREVARKLLDVITEGMK